jgi:Family of unknown function (DUF6272)
VEINNFTLKDYLKWNEIVLGYRGAITQELIIIFLRLAETKIYPKYASQAFKRKIFSVFVETLQNIHKYAIPDETGFNNAYFLVREIPNGLQISTGNVVTPEAKENLEKKLISISNKDIEELKETSKKKLFEERNSQFDSVGVGLLELAIKSSKHMVYKFRPVDANTYLFTLEIDLIN